MLPMRLTRFIARQIRVRPALMRARRPVASITFDDFPKSAWTVGGPVLARFGARGTYYTAGNFCGRTVNGTLFYDEGDLSALAKAGHEIGCHGFGHQPTPTLDSGTLAQDMERNAQFLKPFLGGAKPQSYAYPFGASSLRTKKFYAPHFSNLRGVHPGINQGAIDLSQLNAVSLEMRSFSSEKLDAAIAGALGNNGWISFYTHDVSDSPSEYGSTPEILATTLERVAAAGIEVLPMREAVTVALG
jgi:peptidoglycan/xylan/chitin deacetylase (PgdA/CDA1 family)